MEKHIIKYRGKSATSSYVEFINNLMKDNPNASRYALSKLLCKEWNWIQPNGALRDMVARGFMLKLHREGYIRLPDKRNNPNNPFINRKKPAKIQIDQTKIKAGLAQIKPLEIKQVRKTSHEKLFNSLKDWEAIYNHPIFFLETFVYTQHFLGTCYKAANWQYLGDTTGRGKNDHTKKPNRSIKAVWGYPLSKNFRSYMRA
jgi:hypothetical protein